MRPSWCIWVGINPITIVSTQDTQKRGREEKRPFEEGDRDWCYIATSKGTPGVLRASERQASILLQSL